MIVRCGALLAATFVMVMVLAFLPVPVAVIGVHTLFVVGRSPLLLNPSPTHDRS